MNLAVGVAKRLAASPKPRVPGAALALRAFFRGPKLGTARAHTPRNCTATFCALTIPSAARQFSTRPNTMLPLLPALAAAARGGHTPAFFWSSLSDTGLGRSAQHLHEASAADVERTFAALAGGSDKAPLLAPSSTSRPAPELQLVFLFDKLPTDAVRPADAGFDAVARLMADSRSSLSAPFTTRTSSAGLFKRHTRVAADKCEEYLAAHPELATNGKPDTLVVTLAAPKDASAGNFGAADALVAKIHRAAEKATGGKVAALMTGEKPVPAPAGSSARATVTPGHPMASRRSLSEAGPGSGYQTTPGILIGLLVGLLLLLIFIPGFCCIFQVCIPPPLPRAPYAPAAPTPPSLTRHTSRASLPRSSPRQSTSRIRTRRRRGRTRTPSPRGTTRRSSAAPSKRGLCADAL